MKSAYSMIPAAVLTALVIGCGGKTEQAATPAADSTAAPAAPAAAPASTAVADVPMGQYAVCQACHQENGQGLPPAFPSLAGSELVNGPAEFPIAIVIHGLQGPLTVNGTDYNGMMAPWGTFSDEDIAATLTYERASWGNTGSAVTAAEVAAVRAATSSRKTPWTWTSCRRRSSSRADRGGTGGGSSSAECTRITADGGRTGPSHFASFADEDFCHPR